VRVLICHNYYGRRSGEGSVVEREAALLQEQGHSVSIFSYDNQDAHAMGRVELGLRALYSRQTGRDLKSLLEEQSFDVAHVHNTWLLMSPTVYRDLWRAGLPVVKTVHNFRWLCPVATFFRDGQRCHDCLEHPAGLLNAIVHRCYEGNLAGSAVAAGRLFIHRDLMRVYWRYIDVIVLQNEFVRQKLIENGFPADRMEIKGNFLRRVERVEAERGDHAVFFGRLETAKGLGTLLDAFESIEVPLHIFGQGPLEDWVSEEVQRRFGENGRVRFEGFAPRDKLVRTIASSRAVIFPSEWYESYPISIIEAQAHSKPVIASDIGSMPTIVKNEQNGLLFEAGNPAALTECVLRLWADNELQVKLERGALEAYESNMSPEKNYDQLLAIYQRAIESRKIQMEEVSL